MSELPSRAPYLDNDTLRGLRKSIESHQTREESLHMIGRNVTYVLGHDLVTQFTVSKVKKANNPIKRMHNYAKPVVILAAGLGWEENTPILQILSTQLFLRAEERMHKHGLIVDNRRELLDKVDRKLTQYRKNTQISDQEQVQILLLMEYFTLGFRRYNLYRYLDEGDTGRFWRQLQQNVKEKTPALLQHHRTVVSGDMQQGDRSELQRWLRDYPRGGR